MEGHAFIVEAAVSVGGQDLKQGINVHRFANRIPLLFEVTTQAHVLKEHQRLAQRKLLMAYKIGWDVMLSYLHLLHNPDCLKPVQVEIIPLLESRCLMNLPLDM